MSYSGPSREFESVLQAKAHRALTEKLQDFYRERAKAAGEKFWGEVQRLLKPSPVTMRTQG